LLLNNYELELERKGFFELGKNISKSKVVFALPPLGYDMNNANRKLVQKYGRDFDSYFISTLVENLPDHGRAIVITTPSFLTRESKIAKEVKNNILENAKIKSILQLPEGFFQPITGISTIVLIIEKTKPTKNYKIFMSDMDMKLRKGEHIAKNITDEIKEKFDEFSKKKQIKENSLGFLTTSEIIREEGWSIRDKSPIYRDIDIKNASKLKDLVELIQGREYIQIENGEEIPQIRASDIINDDIENISKSIKIPSKTFKNKNFPLVKNGDILFSSKGIIGKKAVVSNKKDAIIGSHMTIIRPNLRKIDPDYLLYYLGQDIFKFQLRGKIKGALPSISIDDLGKIKIPLPDLKEQKIHVKDLKKIQEQIKKAKSKLEELENKRNQYLSGS